MKSESDSAVAGAAACCVQPGQERNPTPRDRLPLFRLPQVRVPQWSSRDQADFDHFPVRFRSIAQKPIAMANTRLEGPVSGEPFFMASIQGLEAAGYVREEWFLSGTANSYTLAGDASPDGEWRATRGASAPFNTRMVVHRPEDPARFSGTRFPPERIWWR